MIAQSDESHSRFIEGHYYKGNGTIPAQGVVHDIFEPSWQCESKSRVPNTSGEVKCGVLWCGVVRCSVVWCDMMWVVLMGGEW